jgi:hypothetical protein
MKRPSETKKNGGQKRGSAASQINSMQRKGQTVTILFGRKRPGPSVKLLFEEADLQACNNIALGAKSS